MKRSIFRQTAIALMIAAVAFTAACSGDDPVEPDPPKPSSSLETISITAPAVKDANRTITDKAGEFSYSDKADATVKMTFKNAEPATKDSAITIPLVSKVTWLTTVTKAALTGELVLTPALTGTDKISVKYGTLEVKDLFTVSNTTFKVTRSGKTADMPSFGFNKVEAVGDAVNAVTYVTEGDKNYTVSTLTQTFKLSHSDGTTKEVEIAVLEARKDMTGVKPKLVGYEEVSRKVSENLFSVTYVIRHNYSFGDPVDKEVTAYLDMNIDNILNMNSVYFLKKDWTLISFESVKYEKIRDIVNEFDDFSFLYIRGTHTYQFSFKEALENKFEEKITFNEVSYVSGGLAPLKLTAC